MKLNLDDRFCPAHVLDFFPENPSDEQILKDFMGNVSTENDRRRIYVEPIDGGITIWME